MEQDSTLWGQTQGNLCRSEEMGGLFGNGVGGAAMCNHLEATGSAEGLAAEIFFEIRSPCGCHPPTCLLLALYR